MAENSNVQDAFVIAVEQQARERLEKLSALRKIKPVDMTALSQQVENKISNLQIQIKLAGAYAVASSFLYAQIYLEVAEIENIV